MQDQTTVRARRASLIRQKRSLIQDNLKNLVFSNRKPSYNRESATQDCEFIMRERSKTYCYVQDSMTVPLQKTSQFQIFYELGQKLGQGMHAVVYKCKELKTGNLYAVKKTKCSAQELFFMIERAFNMLKLLSHPGIIRAKDLFMDLQSQVCYMVTDLVQKPTLRAYIESLPTRKLDEPAIKKIIIKLLSPLNYLHAKKICHRDIKPENILYDCETNQLSLIDFDIACQQKITEEKLEMWTDTGSLFYRAPESFQTGYNQKIDVWAVGVIAYELFTGKLPFVKKSKEEIIKKLNDQDLKKDICAHLTDASQDFKKFVAKLLTQDPDQRPNMNQIQNEKFLSKMPKQLSQSVLTNDSTDSNTLFSSFKDLSKLIQPRCIKSKSLKEQSDKK